MNFPSLLRLVVAAAVLSLSVPAVRSQPTATLNTLHSFSNTDSDGRNNDGNHPFSGLIRANDGNLYGTTNDGGINGHGAVFQLTPDGVLTVLHSFDFTNGASPYGALVEGNDGYFYGTTSGGGRSPSASFSACGTIFRFALLPSGVDFQVIHEFDGTDGSTPTAGLARGSDGDLYGTTSGGATHTDGTVFRVTTQGMVTVLHTFSGDEGALPLAGLTLGSDGNFYGTTSSGGAHHTGTIFRVSPTGDFADLHDLDGGDGEYPAAELVLGGDGNFYGTTPYAPGFGGGTVFQVTPAGIFTSLHAFADGEGNKPQAALVEVSSGVFVGTTTNGGTGGGTVFKITISASAPHPAFFSGETALSDGVYYLVFPSGNYFGYYSYLSDPRYVYHFDLGYEYVFDAQDGRSGVYLYDFASRGFFYTSPSFPFPYLYDFTLNTVLYYYPDPNNPGKYNTDGTRFFYRFDTGQIFTK